MIDVAALHAAFAQQLYEAERIDGVAAANAHVAAAPPDTTLLFLTRAEYGDLLICARLPALKRYKGRTIIVTSDPQGATA